jgi:hypothetical protein
MELPVIAWYIPAVKKKHKPETKFYIHGLCGDCQLLLEDLPGKLTLFFP